MLTGDYRTAFDAPSLYSTLDKREHLLAELDIAMAIHRYAPSAYADDMPAKLSLSGHHTRPGDMALAILDTHRNTHKEWSLLDAPLVLARAVADAQLPPIAEALNAYLDQLHGERQ